MSNTLYTATATSNVRSPECIQITCVQHLGRSFGAMVIEIVSCTMYDIRPEASPGATKSSPNQRELLNSH